MCTPLTQAETDCGICKRRTDAYQPVGTAQQQQQIIHPTPEEHSPEETKEEAPERSWSGSSKTAKSPRRDSEAWWSRARSLAPGTASEASSDIVRCEIGSSVQYTNRTDCRLRGGRAATR